MESLLLFLGILVLIAAYAWDYYWFLGPTSRAWKLVAAGDHTKAKACLKPALSHRAITDSSRVEVLNLLAYLHWMDRDYADGEAVLTELLRTKRDDYDFATKSLWKVDALFGQEKNEAAEQLLAELRTRYAGNPAGVYARLAQARVAEYDERWADAASAYEAALATTPWPENLSRTFVLLNYTRPALHAGFAERALVAARQCAAEKDPWTRRLGHQMAAAALLKRLQFDAAREHAAAAEAQARTDGSAENQASALAGLASVWLAEGKLSEVETIYGRLVALGAPGAYFAALLAVDLAQARGEWETAQERIVEAASARRPGPQSTLKSLDAALNVGRARLHSLRGHHTEALLAIEAVQRGLGRAVWERLEDQGRLAWILARAGDSDAAQRAEEALAAQATTVSPECLPHLVVLEWTARSQFERGAFAESEAHFLALLAQNPAPRDRVMAWFHLGELRRLASDNQGALPWWHSAAESGHEGIFVDRSRQRLQEFGL